MGEPPVEVVMKYRFSDFELDLVQHELRREGVSVHIEPQVFDVIVHLVRNHDRVVSKDELIDTVWHGRAISEAAFSSRINGARRVLGDNGTDQLFIKTLHRRGFRFVGDVQAVGASDADAVRLVPDDTAAASDVPRVSISAALTTAFTASNSISEYGNSIDVARSRWVSHDIAL